jgi:hypothetical protein
MLRNQLHDLEIWFMATCALIGSGEYVSTPSSRKLLSPSINRRFDLCLASASGMMENEPSDN